MKRTLSYFVTIILLGTTFSAYASSGIGTSIKIDEKYYNLIILSPGEYAKIIRFFNGNLKSWKKEGEITRCSFLIDLPVGIARGNHSYGGFCDLVTDYKMEDVMICSDVMVGRLVMKKLDADSYSDREINNLAEFTAKNCYGG